MNFFGNSSWLMYNLGKRHSSKIIRQPKLFVVENLNNELLTDANYGSTQLMESHRYLTQPGTKLSKNSSCTNRITVLKTIIERWWIFFNFLQVGGMYKDLWILISKTTYPCIPGTILGFVIVVQDRWDICLVKTQSWVKLMRRHRLLVWLGCLRSIPGHKFPLTLMWLRKPKAEQCFQNCLP